MFGGRTTANPAAELEAHAANAGLALACPFSSADEYTAALIAERRAAGIYGPKRHRKQMLVTSAGVLAALATIVYIVH